MRDLPVPDAALASAASWSCSVASWLGGTVLADDMRPVKGTATWDSTQNVQSHVDLTFPPGSFPESPSDPLARFGQQLDVAVVVQGVRCRLGFFQVQDVTEQDDGSVQVTAQGLLQAVSDDQFQQATTPRADGTLASEFLRLLPGWMSCQIDPDLVDRAVPTSLQWDTDRLAALYSITDAWPARIYVDETGTVNVLPPLPSGIVTPVATWTDGEGGTLVSAPRADTRAGSYNTVVYSSSADGVDAQAVAQVVGGPMDPTGPYHPVVTNQSSPLVTTVAQCQAAAQTYLQHAVMAAQTVQVNAAPDPRVELGDAAVVVRAGQRRYGYVTGIQMPLTVGDGAMQVNVGVV